MKIFSGKQVKSIDNFTIANEPISSVNLMERAAIHCSLWICNHFDSRKKVLIFAGCGNNGGDGLAIARLLIENSFQVEVFLIKTAKNLSDDAQINFIRLQKSAPNIIHEITDIKQLPTIDSNNIVVDAIFGSGLSRPLTGLTEEIVNYLNISNACKIAIDIPSGMPTDGLANNNSVFKAQHTLTFQFPFLSFFFHENSEYIGKWHVIDINIMIPGNEESNIYFTEQADIKIKKRPEFGHKGTFGHALIIAGSKGMAGAAILSTKACLKSGCGMVTSHVPSSITDLMHVSFPETIVNIDISDDYISTLPELDKYKAVAIGPGLGQHINTALLIYELLQQVKIPLIIDADALNIIAANPHFFKVLPKDTIITPHPGEFDRLFGSSENSFERFQKQVLKAQELGIIIVLKGRYTCIALPNGKAWFNSTGNNGMATAGSGDVLTGVIVSLLAQGYESSVAAINGVFIHGLAADIAVEYIAHESLVASNIIDYISNAFIKIKTNKNNE